jgi:hypothetical protein
VDNEKIKRILAYSCGNSDLVLLGEGVKSPVSSISSNDRLD